ncbi:hypothetical protein T4A_13239 [Trichinella pseudospiralis]|uniref:Uncharacterized protein n=1 Tax=Trichinella pseudospiralis TaxID=6337 RepID=A0A0V1E4K8_TRIPS|nr:hypothetical protein T4A_13239 [Trichinella pseudospiralis]
MIISRYIDRSELSFSFIMEIKNPPCPDQANDHLIVIIFIIHNRLCYNKMFAVFKTKAKRAFHLIIHPSIGRYELNKPIGIGGDR